MALELKIKHSEEIIRWLDKKIDGINIPADTNLILAGACLDMAGEHHKSIILLIANNLTGSAFALLRSQFEAYIRGNWIFKCAYEDEIKEFKIGNAPRNIQKLINDLEETRTFNTRIISRSKESIWKIFNGFTHTGIEQISNRILAETIEPDYSYTDICQAVDFSNSLGFLSAIAICDLANDTKTAFCIKERMEISFPQSDNPTPNYTSGH